MVILVGAMIVFGLAYEIYRSGRSYLGRVSSNNPEIARLFDAENDGFGNEKASVAEAREADLCRELLDGNLDRGAYQRAMTELAQADSIRTGGAR